MSEQRNDFALLMERLQAGSPEAARELVQKYGPALLMTVRRQLNKELRSKYDSRDFVQDAWLAFLTDLGRGHTFDRPEALGKFLVDLARHKVLDTTRQRLRSLKYNVNREQSLNDSVFRKQHPLPGPDLTPSTLVMREEEWELLLKRQPLGYRKILILLRQGRTQVEIAHEIGMSQKTISRVIHKVLPRSTP